LLQCWVTVTLQTVMLYAEYYFIMLSVIKLIAVMPDASFLIAIFLNVVLSFFVVKDLD